MFEKNQVLLLKFNPVFKCIFLVDYRNQQTQRLQHQHESSATQGVRFVLEICERLVQRDKHYSPLGAQASNTFDFNTFWFAAHSKRSFHCWLCRKTSEVYNSLILSFYSFNPCFCNFSFFFSILTKQTDLIKINNFSERMTQIFNILRE